MKYLLLGLTCFILIGTAACTPTHNRQTPTPTSETITLSPVAQATETAAPRATIQVTRLVTPTPTPSPTAVPPTLTPLPTIAAEELETAVADLLANPMNCDVPCWWGAIPGITSLNEIKYAVSPYNFDIYEYEENGEVIILRLGIGYVEWSGDFEVRVGYGFSHSILLDVLAYSPPISEFLAQYGQPDEVWLETMSFMRETLPFRLNMVYLQEGMAVGYVVDGDIQDDIVIGCFAAEETGRLRLIVPNTATSYRDFPTIFEEERRYLPLEEATNLTMEDFVRRFGDPT